MVLMFSCYVAIIQLYRVRYTGHLPSVKLLDKHAKLEPAFLTNTASPSLKVSISVMILSVFLVHLHLVCEVRVNHI